MNVTLTIKFAFDRVKKIVGQGENTGYQNFLHYPLRFQKCSSSGLLKVGTELKKGQITVPSFEDPTEEP